MGSVLIETLWNVKIETVITAIADAWVLIETLWNVKIFAEAIEELKDLVLIETLWNVKTGTYILCIDGHVY